jgi:hypothetical protein
LSLGFGMDKHSNFMSYDKFSPLLIASIFTTPRARGHQGGGLL